MKHFAIGDGNKRISSPDRYKADNESDDTTVLWDPEHVDIPIRVTVITVTPKNKRDEDCGFWHVINKAQEQNSKPRIDGNKSIYAYRETSSEPNSVLHFYEVGLGNHVGLFSITVSKSEESSTGFSQIRMDLEAMIRSFVERRDDEQFDCNLLECDVDRINESLSLLLPTGIGESSWSILQKKYDHALEKNDNELTRNVGLVFGEMMKREIPSFSWSVKIDDDGRVRALDFADSGISIFPEDMIRKRIDRAERIDLRQFSSNTIDVVERMFRDYQQKD